ncbi:MAG: hypothetical protein A2651_01315 [Candidatus Yanofskybacteria bacterium RIFCSPHIGHO2_01_FULL_42_12]|uniref:Uncharacterized protein n=1 Tax=Candidatus Yanofskybacteria bacterium RIFCSPLOWO2_01_FULL_42_49 TaxID=1802694 RepID=A0A1F8G9W7_9BACT|nr:MAG: hypothetical protein A2651_01315 [Candidatus Yanofskybacteria bacterium RIFCSPHIGHO2_01_FULL_42_12]OGN22113.1 MAG: hypothetical protein A2918_03055 [Candidatus Yanofskybacteria bacterium RIFCSPLOWO2_01_FULL_42_49]
MKLISLNIWRGRCANHWLIFLKSIGWKPTFFVFSKCLRIKRICEMQILKRWPLFRSNLDFDVDENI